MEEPKSSPSASNPMAWVIGTGVFLGILILPVLAIGGCLWWFGRGRLKRVEAIVLSLAAAGTGILLFTQWGPEYGHWLKSFLPHGKGSPWSVPILPILVWGVALGCVGILIDSTVIGNKVSFGVGQVKKRLRGEDPFTAEQIVPPAHERQQHAGVVVPPSNTVVRVPHHKTAADGPSRFLLGYGKGNAPVWLTAEDVATHMIVLGTTGSGKSVTLRGLAGGLADVGWDIMVLDLKEDTQQGGLRDFLRDYAHYHVLPYQELALSDPNPHFWFDPVTGMGRDEMRDTILSLQKFDDQHWQSLSKNLLGQLISLMHHAYQIDPATFTAPTMREVGRIMQSGDLPSATKKMRAILKSQLPTYSEDSYASLINPSPDEAKTAVGYASKIQQLYITEAGQRVLTPGEGQQMLDVEQRGILYIGLDSNGKADLTSIVSSAVLQRMNVYVAKRTQGKEVGGSTPRAVIVDEAGWINRPIVMNLLARARSAKISLVLATQSPSDWSGGDQGDDWSNIINNTNVTIVMRQTAPEEARTCAEFIGMRKVTTVSRKVGTEGEMEAAGTAREDWDYNVDPETIRSLETGQAILRVGMPARLEYVKIAYRQASE